jgi:hypothetical protein
MVHTYHSLISKLLIRLSTEAMRERDLGMKRQVLKWIEGVGELTEEHSEKISYAHFKRAIQRTAYYTAFIREQLTEA